MKRILLILTITLAILHANADYRSQAIENHKTADFLLFATSTTDTQSPNPIKYVAIYIDEGKVYVKRAVSAREQAFNINATSRSDSRIEFTLLNSDILSFNEGSRHLSLRHPGHEGLESYDVEIEKTQRRPNGYKNPGSIVEERKPATQPVEIHEQAEQRATIDEPEPYEKVYQAVESPASFPGGSAALMKWLINNLRYPESAQQNDIQGRVIVEFIVEKNGSITHPRVVRGVNREIDAEAIRLMNTMPKWEPAIYNGTIVRSYFTLPVTFKLQTQ